MGIENPATVREAARSALLVLGSIRLTGAAERDRQKAVTELREVLGYPAPGGTVPIFRPTAHAPLPEELADMGQPEEPG